jgi:hypothetical protein
MAHFVQVGDGWINLDRVNMVDRKPRPGPGGPLVRVYMPGNHIDLSGGQAEALLRALEWPHGAVRAVEDAAAAGAKDEAPAPACDYCGAAIPHDPVRTCDAYRPLTLCPDCYRAADNTVR